MNRPLRHLATIVTLMFVVLMLAATNLQFVQAPSLNADGRNVRTLYREYGTERGPIVVAGTPIVTSTPINDPYKYLRSYAHGPLYAPITGYFSTSFNSMTGLERAENPILGGSDEALAGQRLQELINGRQPQGGGVVLTINPKAQEAAYKALGDQRGAVVAIEPSTGKILALVSTPSFDPNSLATHNRGEADKAWKALNADPTKPLINRAIAGDLYAPGSSFKLVTATAMLESGLTPESEIPAPTDYVPAGTNHHINNPGERPCGDGSGTATLRHALVQSCNTAFALGGLHVGAAKMMATAEAFGFGKPLSIPLKVTPSQFPKPDSEAALAMDSFGQKDIRVTPIQMAMISAAIANKGILMRPYLVDKVLSADLAEISTTKPEVFSSPMSATTAEQLTSMMIDVVKYGTGRRARIPGIEVAGKTGTAEISRTIRPHAWFTSFAPANNPKVAVAVVVENGGDNDGDGGSTAAPIAKKVIEAVLNG